MKLLDFLLYFVFSFSLAKGSNVAISSDGVAIIAGEGLDGLVSRQLPNGEEQIYAIQDLTDTITGFDTVTIDPDNPTLLFALGQNDRQVCSFIIQEDASLQVVNCVFGFLVSPYSGISVKNGSLVVSGGEAGFTVYSYESDAMISGLVTVGNSELLHTKLLNAAMHPNVIHLSQTFAAISTEFDDSSYGTMVVDLTVPEEVGFFKVQNSLGTNLALPPANFPLQSALYTSLLESQTVIFTANGAMTVQDPFTPDSTRELTLPGFSVFTLAVNQEKHMLVLGGVDDDSGNFRIEIYSIANPTQPEKYFVAATGRLTSVATQGDLVVYTTTATEGTIQKTSYSLFEIPESASVPSEATPSELPPATPSEPASVPSDATPSELPPATPSEVSPATPSEPASVPSEAPSLSSIPTVSPAPTGPSESPSPSSDPTMAPASSGVAFKYCGISILLVNYWLCHVVL
jgi:hypothetical protein